MHTDNPLIKTVQNQSMPRGIESILYGNLITARDYKNNHLFSLAAGLRATKALIATIAKRFSVAAHLYRVVFFPLAFECIRSIGKLTRANGIQQNLNSRTVNNYPFGYEKCTRCPKLTMCMHAMFYTNLLIAIDRPGGIGL